jgi:hypothetical protein
MSTGARRGPDARAVVLAASVHLCGCATVETSVEIHAPAQQVRSILFDFADYPKWNPYLVSVEGVAEKGRQIAVTVKMEGKPELTGDVTVLSADDGGMSWTGSALSQFESGTIDVSIPGTLTARHEFLIEALGPDRTRFTNKDELSGALVVSYNSASLEKSLNAMNAALKKRAEEAKGAGP